MSSPIEAFFAPYMDPQDKVAVGQTLLRYGRDYCVDWYRYGRRNAGARTPDPRFDESVNELLPPKPPSDWTPTNPNKFVLHFVVLPIAAVIAAVLLLAALYAILYRIFGSVHIVYGGSGLALIGGLVATCVTRYESQRRYAAWVDSLIAEFSNYVREHGDFTYVPNPKKLAFRNTDD